MDWFKTKKSVSESTASPEHLLSLVRTMEDDIAGREIPTEITKPVEPLVTFRPDAAVGAPFFAAPGVAIPAEPQTAPTESSPFLTEAVETTNEPVVESPTFDPPLPTTAPENVPQRESEAVEVEHLLKTIENERD